MKTGSIHLNDEGAGEAFPYARKAAFRLFFRGIITNRILVKTVDKTAAVFLYALELGSAVF